MSMLGRIKGGLEAIRSLLYPNHCAGCDRAMEAESATLCDECSEAVPRLAPPFCSVCAQPYSGELASAFRCENCGGRRFAFEFAVSAYLSRGIVRRLIHGFKYDRRYDFRHQLGEWLGEAFRDPRLVAAPPDLLVPVPLHPTRRRERSFNQALELARIAGARTGIPVRDCLRRVRYTSTQTRLDRVARIENLRGTFELRHDGDVKDQSVVLIDDVFTTGSTADECARVLRRCGAANVRVAAVARG
jgi:ComF family protein